MGGLEVGIVSTFFEQLKKQKAQKKKMMNRIRVFLICLKLISILKLLKAIIIHTK